MSRFFLYAITLMVSLLLFAAFDIFPTDCSTSCNNIIKEAGLESNHPVTPKISDSCYWKGIPLYGKVKFVESFPDVKIKFVESFPDIRVKFVNAFPDKCGRWQVVESFPDLKVQVVESFPDIKVKIVESFPGIDN